jgi:hypothetical protein
MRQLLTLSDKCHLPVILFYPGEILWAQKPDAKDAVIPLTYGTYQLPGIPELEFDEFPVTLCAISPLQAQLLTALWISTLPILKRGWDSLYDSHGEATGGVFGLLPHFVKIMAGNLKAPKRFPLASDRDECVAMTMDRFSRLVAYIWHKDRLPTFGGQ